MVKMEKSVDIGSGGTKHYPWGKRASVNVDILKPETRIPNFILADAHHLPFKDGFFRKAYCSHVLEHVDSPETVIKELLRICNGTILIRVPHRLSPHAGKDPSHKWSFRCTWFHTLLRRLGCTYALDVKYKKVLWLFDLPFEIRVVIRK